MMQQGIVLFDTELMAIGAWKLLTDNRHPAKIVPTPKQFSKGDCGIALKFDWNQRKKLNSLLSSANVEIAAIYFLGISDI